MAGLNPGVISQLRFCLSVKNWLGTRASNQLQNISLIKKPGISIRAINTLRFLLASLILSLAFSLASIDVLAQSAIPPSHLSFRHVLPPEVETLGWIASIHADAQGFMWFGGDNGLGRYDGYELKIYRYDENNPFSISANVINHILQTRNGDLWITTLGGLNLYEAETDRFIRYTLNGEPGDSNDVRHLLEDSQGRLWVGATSGFYQLDPSDMTTRRIDIPAAADAPFQDRMIWVLTEDRQGNIWIGHNIDGITRYNPRDNTFERYKFNPRASTHSISGLTHNAVRKLFIDSRDTLWVGTLGGGLHRYDAQANRFIDSGHYAGEKGKEVFDIIEDENGLIWLGDGTSIHIFNPQTEQYSRFRFSESNATGPGNHAARSMYQDKNKDIWIGYYPAGVDIVDKRASVFHNYVHNPTDRNSLADGGILAGFEDPRGNLWVGAGFGLNYFNRRTGEFTRFEHDPKDPGSLSGSTVLSILQDNHRVLWPDRQSLWVGTWDRGLNRRDSAKSKFIHYLPDADRPGAIVGREPWDLLLDRQGTLWVVTEEALNRYNPETDSFRAYIPGKDQMEGDSKFHGRSVFEDSEGKLWVSGIHGFYLFDRPSGKFTEYYRQDPNAPDTSLRNNFVWSIFEDSRNQLWLGTNGGGLNLFDRKTRRFSAYGTKEGLPDPVITGIVEDEQGYLWLSTLKGLARFDDRNKSFRHYDRSNGLAGNLFNRKTPIRLSSGELFFGSSKGFTLFRPEDLKLNPLIPRVVLTDFQIFNQSVIVGDEKSPLQKTITTTDTIDLKHHQSVFSFEFAALNYRAPEANEYAYRLEGFDDHWNYVGKKRTATYTNLNPGHYVFRVKASNNDNIWNEEGVAIEVNILPPFWRTWWAYCIYVLIIAGLLYWFYLTQQIKLAFERSKVEQERAKVEQERSLVKRLRAVDKLRDDFLANTSHELRTPLNGIVGLAQSLLDGVTGTLPELTRQNLAMIVTSGKRLSHLVNDILDFSKLKNRNVHIRPKPLDLYTLAKMVLTLSQPLVGKKNVRLNNLIAQDLPTVSADEDHIIQVLHNLVGNAIKFTDAGEISVNARVTENEIFVSVKDTGIGIPADQHSGIFDAFHQVEDSVRRTQGGTGLGLSITKKLIELHGGRVSVKSAPGQGSEFGFTLPLNAEVLHQQKNNSPIIVLDPVYDIPDNLETEEPAHNEIINLEDNNSLDANILVVDDDEINRKVLFNYLSLKNYQVFEATGGDEAIKLIHEQGDIDLVLLDIMMPHTSGYDVCKRLREQYSAQELPIIFLTARNQMTDLVTGFALGANDFLHKPIAREELLARVHTHLQLLDIHRNLDQKVAERTAELDQKNKRLNQMQEHLKNSNEKLEEASLTDPLTGLRNRRFLNKFIGSDIAMVERSYRESDNQHPNENNLIFILLDLDHFKTVNDQHGHTAGDQILEQLSSLLQDVLRASDYLIRWGGEEFLLVMRFCARAQAEEMAERIRRSVNNYLFNTDAGVQLKITCSIGFAPYPFYTHNIDAISWEQVIAFADRALYAAKNAGRNCWVGLEPGESTQAAIIQPGSDDLLPRVNSGELRLLCPSDLNINKL